MFYANHLERQWKVNPWRRLCSVHNLQMRRALKKIPKTFYRFLISSDKLLCAHLNLILRTILGPASISQPEPRTPFVWGYFSHPTPIHLGNRSLILEIRSSYFLGKIILTWSEERKQDNLVHSRSFLSNLYFWINQQIIFEYFRLTALFKNWKLFQKWLHCC